MPNLSRFKTYRGGDAQVEWMIDFEEIDLYSEQRNDGGLSLSLLWKPAAKQTFEDLLDTINLAYDMSQDNGSIFQGMDHETCMEMQQDIKRYQEQHLTPA